MIAPKFLTVIGWVGVGLTLTLLVSVLPPAVWADESEFSVGVCQRDITPISPGLAAAYEAAFGVPAVVNHSDPIFLSGFGNGRQATGYNDQLWARGVVVNGRGGRVALVALDVVGYFVNEIETIRAMVAPGSLIDYLIVHSTHQHQGPDTMGLWGPDQLTSGIDFAYLDFVNASTPPPTLRVSASASTRKTTGWVSATARSWPATSCWLPRPVDESSTRGWRWRSSLVERDLSRSWPRW
jgi:hypothetical protein